MTTQKHIYFYGMRLRGFAPGAQPTEGLLMQSESDCAFYYNILIYNRTLTDEEKTNYELDFIVSLNTKDHKKFLPARQAYKESAIKGTISEAIHKALEQFLLEKEESNGQD